MKTIITLVVAALAVGSQAAQINWGSQGYLYDGSTQMRSNQGYSTTAYLLYLGSGEGADFGTIDADFFSNLSDNAIAQKTANALGSVGATTGANIGFTPGTTTIGNTSDTYTYGSSVFGIVYVMSNPGKYEDDSYFYTTGPFTLVNSGSTYAAATETTTFTAAVPNGSSWTKVPTVPEPSSAALALAGLALLIKRRRA